ncbi:hypothetical protein QFC22_004393 [Naganishia vaughanmartiniae]|uniref:Uncharacterized protein n=1 Tax=Naganishia vaughanmartiniae TaxID=1424756 RepID=A0ACC2X1E7_9TREE|nr:hypothetical protein QFC22_004393 [Naganishia vaughanmartiniae]
MAAVTNQQPPLPPRSHRSNTLHPDLLFPDVPDAEEDLLLFAPTASTSHEGLSQWSIDQIGTDAAAREQYNRSLSGGRSDKGKGKLVDFEQGGDARRTLPTSPIKEGRIRDGDSRPRSGIFDEDQPLVSPLGAKAIASVTGAVMTSLLMTPFDVLKTRLQTHRPSSTPANQPNIVCCQTGVIPEIGRSGVQSTTITSTSSFTQSGRSSTTGMTCLSSSGAAAESATASISSQTAQRFFPLSTSGSSAFAASAAPTASSAGAAALYAPPPPEGCLHPSKWSGIWGETMTLDEAQSLLRGAEARRGATVVQGSGFWQEVRVVLQDTGYKGLWRGTGTALAMSIPSAAIYMIGYEHLLSLMTSRVPQPSSTSPAIFPQSTALTVSVPTSTSQPYLTPTPFIAGCIARTISATVISPMELFRTRLQALPGPGEERPTYKNTAESISNLVKQRGITSLWRGLGPTLWRDVPFSGVYWAGFESTKKYLTESQTLKPGLTMTFISGAISGTAASILTAPFDVLKTRRQVFTPAATCSPQALNHPASTIPLLLHVIRTEGWRALFAGVVPRTAKVAPACGMMIGCYEGVGKLLGGKAGSRM